MPTELLSRAAAHKSTKPFHKVWVDAYLRSWDMWSTQLTGNADFVAPLTSGDRCLLLHRHVTSRIAKELEASRAATWRLDFFGQLIGDQALVRFKHLDANLKPTNYPTDQQKHLERQEYNDRMAEQLALDGLRSPPTFITCGYTLTAEEDNISRVVLVCHSPELRWAITLFDREQGSAEGSAGGYVEVQPFPSMPPTPPRVLSKRIKADRKERDAQ